MLLWTIQPVEVYQLIQDSGVYRCDPELISMPEYKTQYDWLADQMKQRISPPPEGVKYPVWAWFKWYGKHEKPDLRRMRWETGADGEKLVCLEIEIADEQVLLSDYDVWHLVLGNWLISETEDESDQIESYLDRLKPEEASNFRSKNWERVFDITPFSNGWITSGRFVQACFWELRKEQVRNVRHFTAKSRKY